MDLRQLRGGWTLVTGGASGIGRACAEAAAAHRSNVVICDLDREGLATVEEGLRKRGVEVLARRVDVADRAAMADLATEVHRRIEALDLLVNNAGVALGATFLESTLDDWDWILDINLRGVVHGCHFFVPAMVRRGRGGHVVNVASMAGFTAGPRLSAYCATKFGVVGLSEALRAELAPQRVGVTALCPGVINTPIVDNARLRGVAADEELQRATREMFRKRNYPPERVAERMLRAVARNRGLAPVTPEAWLFYALKRLSPRLAAAAGRLLERASTPATKPPRGSG